MIGIEIVKDKLSKQPATAETKFIVDELKEHFILIGTDGKHDNIIKIKPPMCFNKENSDYLCKTLEISVQKLLK